MNERQRKFVREYIKTNNATQAAITAGYSKKTAYSIGNENLKKPEIKKELEKYQEKQQKKFEYTVEDSFNNLRKAQELALNRKNPLGEANPDLTNFIKAEELKGKLKGLYVEKRELKTIDSSPFEVKIIQ